MQVCEQGATCPPSRSTAGTSCMGDTAGKPRIGLLDAAPASDFEKLGQDYEAARETMRASHVV